MLDSLKRYSSQVTIVLVIAGIEFDVAQVVDGTCYLRDPRYTEPCDGELIIKVDDHEIRHFVHLPHGIRDGQKTVKFF